MSDVILNTPGSGAFKLVRRQFSEIAAGTTLALNLSGATAAVATFSGESSSVQNVSADMNQLHLKTNLANAYTLAGVSFSAGGKRYISKVDGTLQVDPSPVTGNGTTVGTLTPAQGEVTLDAWTPDMAPAVSDWRGVAAAPINSAFTPFNAYTTTFRIASIPIKTASLSVLGTMRDGTTFNVTADSNGVINTPRVKGRINYTTGVVKLVGTAPSGLGDPVDLSWLNIPGLTTAFIDMIRVETLRYNAVAFAYLPLDAELLGIDPVRLPSDGRVPIFRPGELAVVGNEQTTTPATAVVNTPISAGRTRLSRLRLLGANNAVIESGYTEDLEAGTATPTNVTGWSQPVRMEHRIEDTGLIRDAQIDGTITFTRQLTHAYPTTGSYVSSCLRTGDLKARVQSVFDQATWDQVTFSDVLVGNAAPGTYNTAGYPVLVTNAGAITERWALRFKTTQTFDIIGEHVGNIGEGSINTLTAPVNPITGEPYFTIQALGWGNGWSVGNIVRLNTVGAMYPVWMVRTVQQGPEAAADYSFLTIVRGDVDNPVA